MSAPPVSVVMPAYNEEGAIADAVAEVQQHVFACAPEAELVVVNDGSKDRTGEILDGLAAKDPRVKVVHQKNGGHGPAIMAGLSKASGDYVLLIDSDRQIGLEPFPKFWEEAKRHDAVFGLRVVRHDPRLRLVLTRVIRLSLRLLFGVRLYDANVPFKLLKRQLWTDAQPLIPGDTLAPSLFLAVHAASRGRDIVFMEVPHRERTTGVVSIRRWKLFKFCWKAFRQLLSFRRRLRAT